MADSPWIAILRGVRPDEVEAIGAVLVEMGIRVIEVPLNSPDPFESIARLSRRYGDRALIGAGTVMGEADVARVADAGGQIIVTPHADLAVVLAAKSRGLLIVPGFFTPTEAFAMLRAGVDALKLFPAEAGGPAMLRAIRAVLPAGTMVLPVGGVDPDNVAAWMAAGAAGFGIGSAIYSQGDTAAEVGAKAAKIIAEFKQR
ncbi:2-dehydro-3-deoxy-6-phosphogalactonate aldolase [Acidiphilium sp.]|uniref:2-dehydro-3-deoxy-6-phosphogalactonate aldolase n=1 Tax=Acidiphilium sp. TaxID=527 RepID=UPI003D069E10